MVGIFEKWVLSPLFTISCMFQAGLKRGEMQVTYSLLFQHVSTGIETCNLLTVKGLMPIFQKWCTSIRHHQRHGVDFAAVVSVDSFVEFVVFVVHPVDLPSKSTLQRRKSTDSTGGKLIKTIKPSEMCAESVDKTVDFWGTSCHNIQSILTGLLTDSTDDR